MSKPITVSRQGAEFLGFILRETNINQRFGAFFLVTLIYATNEVIGKLTATPEKNIERTAKEGRYIPRYTEIITFFALSFVNRMKQDVIAERDKIALSLYFDHGFSTTVGDGRWTETYGSGLKKIITRLYNLLLLPAIAKELESINTFWHMVHPIDLDVSIDAKQKVNINPIFLEFIRWWDFIAVKAEKKWLVNGMIAYAEEYPDLLECTYYPSCAVLQIKPKTAQIEGEYTDFVLELVLSDSMVEGYKFLGRTFADERMKDRLSLALDEEVTATVRKGQGRINLDIPVAIVNIINELNKATDIGKIHMIIRGLINLSRQYPDRLHHMEWGSSVDPVLSSKHVVTITTKHRYKVELEIDIDSGSIKPKVYAYLVSQ